MNDHRHTELWRALKSRQLRKLENIHRVSKRSGCWVCERVDQKSDEKQHKT